MKKNLNGSEVRNMANRKSQKNKPDGKLGISNLMKFIYEMPLPLVLRNIEQNIDCLLYTSPSPRDCS